LSIFAEGRALFASQDGQLRVYLFLPFAVL
jgi:hypothetical protein